LTNFRAAFFLPFTACTGCERGLFKADDSEVANLLAFVALLVAM